jgi:hypothetical protein
MMVIMAVATTFMTPPLPSSIHPAPTHDRENAGALQ